MTTATAARCKHNMITVACAFCTPPRVANVPKKRDEATVYSTRAVAPEVMYEAGLVVVHTKSGRKQCMAHSMTNIGEDTRIVHIDGAPFLWAFEEILRRAPNLKTIQVIPSALAECNPNSHIRLCQARGVEVKAGHVRPDLVWADGRIVSKQYDGQRRFMHQIRGPQRAIFDELVALGFESAAMASRYFCMGGEDYATQNAIAQEYGMRASANHVVSERILSVLYYLDGTVAVGDGAKRRAAALRAGVERLRPYVASVEARRRLEEELGVKLAADFPMARTEVFRALLAAEDRGYLDALQKRDPKAHRVIVLRFGFDDLDHHVYRTLKDVGELCGGVTRERARQLEERALGALNILED